MPASKESTPHLESGDAASQGSPTSGEGRDVAAERISHQDVLALGMTAAIVAFVGAVVVLSIPYVILSAPLPPSVNRLGLSVETTQGLLFERVWYLLVPSILFALWIGYKFYQWGRSTTLVATHGETTADPTDQEPPAETRK